MAVEAAAGRLRELLDLYRRPVRELIALYQQAEGNPFVVGAPGTVYYMTKSALQSFTRGLAQELGPKDITANLVQPGSTDTDMNPADGESADYQRSLAPLGRFAAPADIAAAVAFLASPGARHLTGTIINVDGGLLA